MEAEHLSSLSGPALAQAVSSALETPGLYVFSDILDLPNVRELESGPHAAVYQLLRLFAYGTYSDYVARAASLPELSPAQRNKLRHLSVVSLASSRLRYLPYSLLLQQLEMKNVRQLEDLLIEAVYSGVIRGKLDQRNQQVEVDSSVGRDLSPSRLPAIVATMQEWCCGCEEVLADIQGQVTRANQHRKNHLQLEAEVSNLHRKLKAASSSASSSSPPSSSGQRFGGPAHSRGGGHGGGGGYSSSNQDEDMPWGDPPSSSSQEANKQAGGKKSSKGKGTSGKIWSKVLKTFKRQPEMSPVGDEGHTVQMNPDPN